MTPISLGLTILQRSFFNGSESGGFSLGVGATTVTDPGTLSPGYCGRKEVGMPETFSDLPDALVRDLLTAAAPVADEAKARFEDLRASRTGWRKDAQ